MTVSSLHSPSAFPATPLNGTKEQVRRANCPGTLANLRPPKLTALTAGPGASATARAPGPWDDEADGAGVDGLAGIVMVAMMAGPDIALPLVGCSISASNFVTSDPTTHKPIFIHHVYWSTQPCLCFHGVWKGCIS